jgi:hypothetical protein
MRYLKYYIVLVFFVKSLDIHAQRTDSLMIDTVDAMSTLIKQLKVVPLINLPYGTKEVLKKFPKEWNTLDTYHNTKVTNTGNTKKLEAYRSKMQQFITNDIAVHKKQISITHNTLRTLFSNEQASIDSIREAIINISVAKLNVQKSYKVYSMQYKAQLHCGLCEYPESILQHYLVTIDEASNIIDKLLISSSKGSDIGHYNKHFYINKTGVIYVKDFYFGELANNFNRSYHYTIDAKGKFALLHK